MKTWLKRLGWTTAILCIAIILLVAYFLGPFISKTHHITANPSSGFHSDYFLYVSSGAQNRSGSEKEVVFLIQPNNSGFKDDDPAPHVSDAWWTCFGRHWLAEDLEVVLLVPTFPRPKTEWKTYTHALDRESVTSDHAVYRRPDLQLIAMIQDATKRLEKQGLKVHNKVLIQGYSASGMFSNRFSFLHPEKVLAVSSGSPGGMPILPAEKIQDLSLPFPAGTSDFEELFEKPFPDEELKKIPQLIVMGDQDDNDAMDFSDSWDQELSRKIQQQIGETPLQRWDKVKQIYLDNDMNVEFVLSKGIGHDRKALQHHTTKFFKKILSQMNK